VRELRNVIERAVILCREDRVGIEHFPVHASARPAEARVGDLVPFDQIEAAHIRRVIAACPTMDEAARVLDIDSATLWRKRRKYGI
jgi:NtrC-family two-component system response regulator AlgB